MLNLTENQANKSVTINSNFLAVNSAEIFSYRSHTALSFSYWGGVTYNSVGNEVTLSNNAVALTNNATNWIYYDPTLTTLQRAVGTNATVVPDGCAVLYKVVTANNLITTIEPVKKFKLLLKGEKHSLFNNTRDNIINKSANFSLTLADSGCTYIHPDTDTTTRTITIPANSAVAFPVGTTFNIINLGGVLNLNITTDTMILNSDGTTGNRVLAQYANIKLLKIDTTKWLLSGSNIT